MILVSAIQLRIYSDSLTFAASPEVQALHKAAGETSTCRFWDSTWLSSHLP